MVCPEPSCRPEEFALAYSEGVAYERITINPNRMSGLPCIRDTRVTVSAVLGQLAAGRSIEEIVIDSRTWNGMTSLLLWSSQPQPCRNANCR